MDYQRISEQLNAAADMIEKNGWWNGQGACLSPNVCALQATTRVARGLKPIVSIAAEDLDVNRFLADYLGLREICYIPDWNDHSTKEKVIEALRAAALVATGRAAAGGSSCPPASDAAAVPAPPVLSAA